jgi:hypothetical protein
MGIHMLSEFDSYPQGLVIDEHTPTPVPLKLYYQCDDCGTRSRDFWTDEEYERLVVQRGQGLLPGLGSLRTLQPFVLLRARATRKRYGLKASMVLCRLCFWKRRPRSKLRLVKS